MMELGFELQRMSSQLFSLVPSRNLGMGEKLTRDNYGSCQLTKYSQPTSWELCFIRQEFLGLQAREAASQVTLREVLQGVGEPGCIIKVLQQTAGSRERRKIIVN